MKEEKKNKRKLYFIFIIILAFMFFSYIVNHYLQNSENKKNHTITKKIANMNNFHVLHSAILLKNGNVLIIGGREGYDNAEIYYSKQKKFKIIKKPFLTGICTTNLLPNGHVVILGEKGIIDFNPNNNLFALRNSNLKKQFANLIDLKDNNLFIFDGTSAKEGLIYNLTNNKFETVLKMKTINNDNIYTMQNNIFAHHLPNNNILIKNQNTIIIYDAYKKKFLSTRSAPYEKMIFTPIFLNKEDILVIYSKQKTGKLCFGYYNLITNKIKQSNEKRTIDDKFSMTKISNYSLLLTGLSPSNEVSNKGIFIFDVKTDSLKYIGNMHYNRIFHQCTLLKDNKTVLITGGTSNKHLSDAQNSAEILNLK